MDKKGNTDGNTMAAFVKLEVEAGCFPRFRHYQHSIGRIFSRFKDKAERKCLLRDISKVGETIEELGLKVKDIEQSPIVVIGPGRTKCPPLSEFLVSSDPYRSTKHGSTFKNREPFCTKSDDLSNGKVTNKQFTKHRCTGTSSNASDAQHPRPKAEKHSTAALIQEGKTSVDTPYVKNGESFCTKSDDLSDGQVSHKQFTKSTCTCTSSNARDAQRPRPNAEKHSLAALIQEGKTLSVDTPYVIVLVTHTSDVEEAYKSLNDDYPGFMKNVSDIQNSNMILYRVTRDEGFRSSSKRNGQVHREDSYKREVFSIHLGKEFDSLSNAIQHSFETKAVRILEILFTLLQPPQSIRRIPDIDLTWDLCEFVRSNLMKSFNKQGLYDLAKIQDSLDVFQKEPTTHVKRFHQRLQEELCRRAACFVTCFLGNKLRLSHSTVFDLLHSFYFARKIFEITSKTDYTSYPEEKRYPPKAAVFVKDICTVLEEAEMCVETSKDMDIQLYHEVLALLLKTKVEVLVSLPEKQTLSTKLQYELARIPNVTGCGLIFGTLTVMVASITSNDELRRLTATVYNTLSGHDYEGAVDIHRGEMIPGAGKCQECIGTTSHQIKTGQRIRATSEEVTLGTLGGFVIGTQTTHTPVTEEATSTAVKQEKWLFGLTCAHCVEDATLVDATIDQNNTLLIWNNASPILKEKCNSIDIAAMSINEEAVQNNCQHPCLRDGDGNETRADILQDTNGLISGQDVFMWVGSELREGVIASDQRFMEDFKGEPTENLEACLRTSIIIYPRQQTPFSNAGDSGGIVFMCAETGAPITAASILVGMMPKQKVSNNSENANETDQEQTYVCSKSYSLKENIDALERKYHLKFALLVPELTEESLLEDIDDLCNESSGQQENLDGPLGAEGGRINEGENDEVDATNEGTASPQDQTQASNDNEDSILDDRQGRRQEIDENQEHIQFQTTDDKGASIESQDLETNEEDDLDVDGCISLDPRISKHDVVEHTCTSRQLPVAMTYGYYFRKQTACTNVYA